MSEHRVVRNMMKHGSCYDWAIPRSHEQTQTKRSLKGAFARGVPHLKEV